MDITTYDGVVHRKHGDCTISLHQRFDQLIFGKTADQVNSLLDKIELLIDREYNKKKLTLGILSVRETEVLILIANGYTRKEIGESLGISSNTAAKHISNIYQKLRISSVAQATRFAIQTGLLGEGLLDLESVADVTGLTMMR